MPKIIDPDILNNQLHQIDPYDDNYAKLSIINWLAQLTITTEDITIIANGYAKYGLHIKLADLIEITGQTPKLKSALKTTLEFLDIINQPIAIPINSKIIIRDLLKFSNALAVVSALGSIRKLPLLKNLTDLSLIYILTLLANNAQHETQAQDQQHNLLLLFYITSMVALTIEETFIFNELASKLKDSNVGNLNTIFTELHQAGLKTAYDAMFNLEQKTSRDLRLLTLFALLSMRLQNLNFEIYGGSSQEIVTNWQDLIDQLMDLQPEAAQPLPKAAPLPVDVKPQAEQKNVALPSSPLDVIFAARHQILAALNDNNHWQASDELQDLLKEIDKLDNDYAALTLAKEQQVVLPPLLLSGPQRAINKVAVTNDFATFEIKISKTSESRIKLTVSCNNAKSNYKPQHTEMHLAACPRYVVIPGFKGKLLLTADGNLIIEQLPKDFNYNFIIANNLHINELAINGRLKGIVNGIVVNHNICAAAGGIVLNAKAVDNKKGIFTTFNVPADRLKKLCKNLAIYRLLIKLTAMQTKDSLKLPDQLQAKINAIKKWFKKYDINLKTGKIYIQTTHGLNNYHGNILSGNNCLLHSEKLDNRHGAIASYNDSVDILSLGDDGAVICTDGGSITAATTLQIKAPKIVKDDTSIVYGLTGTALRSFAGNLRYDGSVVGSNINFIQDHGFYHQDYGVKAQNFTLATNVTSNILEKKLHVDTLQIDVTDPDSYKAKLTHELLVIDAIKLRLPAIDVLKKMRAKHSIAIHTPLPKIDRLEDLLMMEECKKMSRAERIKINVRMQKLSKPTNHKPTYTINIYEQIAAGQIMLSGIGIMQPSMVKARLQYELGFMYEKGLGVPKDFKKAMQHYMKVAEYGDVEQSYFSVGRLYEHGLGVARDLPKAFKLYQLACEQRGFGSLCMIEWYCGEFHLRFLCNSSNDKEAVKQEPLEIIRLIKQLAVQNNPAAQCILAGMHEHGVNNNNIPRDTLSAEQGYEKVIAQKDAFWSKRAAYFLGMMYAVGKYCYKNDLLAVEAYIKAGDAGYPRAQARLGVLYANGTNMQFAPDNYPKERIILKDHKKAIEWLNKAVANPESDNHIFSTIIDFIDRGLDEKSNVKFKECYEAAKKKLQTKEILLQYQHNNLETKKLLIHTNHLHLTAGFKVAEDALLHVTGTASYDPEMLKAGRWLGLHLPLVRDFSFASKIPGSLYAKVLADHSPINLSKDVLVGKYAVVVAPNSLFGGALENPPSTVNSALVKLHTGEGGKILLQMREFKLANTALRADRGVTLLATMPIECGTLEPQEGKEPYIVTNGAVVMATNKDQDIILRHADVSAMEDGLLQGKEIKHVGVKLNIAGALTYSGKPIVDYVIERVTEPKAAEVTVNNSNAGRCGNWRIYYQTRSYINWDKLKSRRSIVNVGGKLTITVPEGFVGSSYINLNHGVYTGVAHTPILTMLKASVSYWNGEQVFHFGESGRHNSNSYTSYDPNYVYETLPFEYGPHSAGKITINAPLTIDYNFVSESIEIDLGEHKLTVGKKLTSIPQRLTLTLTKSVLPQPQSAYIQLIPDLNNNFTYQPIFPINFTRRTFKIIILKTDTDYIIADPADYPLDHPIVEMRGLVETVKWQLGHKRVGNVGLSDYEIYYYMLANALEHAKSGKMFSEATVIKPVLVYKQYPDNKIQLVSLLPKILDIPELRANVDGIFCRLLKVHGTSESSIDLLGAIVSEEGGHLDVGRLSILQQSIETWKQITTTATTKSFWKGSKTTTNTEWRKEIETIEHTGVLKAINNDWKINLSEFKARGGCIVCLNGSTFMRVRNLVDICGLLNINYEYHQSSARTILKKCSTTTFVERQQITPFKLSTKNGVFEIWCDNEIHAEAMYVLAKAGYVYGKNIIDLNATKLWQEMGPVHTKHGMMLSTSHGAKQTAVPCTFVITEGVIFETASTGTYVDTGSLFVTGQGVAVKAGAVEVKPVQLQSKIYTSKSGLLGFAYIKETTTEQHKIHKGAIYTANTGDIVFHATAKDITACAITTHAPEGKVKFVSDHGKVKLLKANDEHSIVTDTKSIGVSFTMSDSVMQAMRGDFSKAMQSSIADLQVVQDINNLLRAEGTLDQGIKGITAANSVVKSLLALQKDGCAGFLGGNLSTHVGITFSKQQKTVNFSEIVGNWLLAKEIIISAKEDVGLEAVNAECKDLYLKSTDGSISVDGGEATSSMTSSSSSTTVGVRTMGNAVVPNYSISKSNQSSTTTTHGTSRFKVTGDAYISAVKGDVTFRNAILEARRAYIEAMRLKLESQRDEVLETARSVTYGTDLKFNKTSTNSKWVQQQTGIRVSDNINIAIEECSKLIGAYIEVKANGETLSARMPNGETQNLYELLLPKDSESGFKVLGIPRAKAISQLFEKADDPGYRAMLAPEIIKQLLMGNLPDPIIPTKDLTHEELLAWANTKECYENYLGFYLALESTPLDLNKQQDLGAMAAIAKINNLNLNIWGKTSDNKLHWSTAHNVKCNENINIAVDLEGNYARLSATPGMLISPTFSYSDVESSYQSQERGLTIDGLVFGEVVGKVKLRDVEKQQINFAHLSGGIALKSNDSAPTSAVKQSAVNSEKRTIEVDTNLVKKIGELAEGLGRLKASLRQYDPDVQKAQAEAKKVLAEQKLEKERLAKLEQEKIEKQEHKKCKGKEVVGGNGNGLVEQKSQQASRQQDVTPSWLKQSALFSDILKFSEKKEPTIENYDLTISEASQDLQSRSGSSSLLKSILSFPTDLLFGAKLYADELPMPEKSSSSSSETSQQPKGIFNIFKSAVGGDPNAQLEMRRRYPIAAKFSDAVTTANQKFEESRRTVEDAHSFNVDNAQPTFVLNGVQSLYGRWKKARRTVEENDFDLDVLLHRCQFNNSKVLSKRDNFQPGNDVFSNSAGITFTSKQASKVYAYDCVRHGDEKLNVGITPYFKIGGKVQPLSFKDFMLSSKMQGDIGFGTNVIQSRLGDQFSLNVDAVRCDGKAETGTSGTVFQGQCAAVSVVATGKTDQVCIGNSCLQCEGSASASIGKVSGTVNVDNPWASLIGTVETQDYRVNINCNLTEKSEVNQTSKPRQKQ